MNIQKKSLMRTRLLIGMGLMIPCYLFTVGNTAFSPWELYDRNRLALVILTPLCLGLLLLLGRAARAGVFEKHERAMLVGFADSEIWSVRLSISRDTRTTSDWSICWRAYSGSLVCSAGRIDSLRLRWFAACCLRSVCWLRRGCAGV